VVPLLTWDSFLNAAVNVEGGILKHLNASFHHDTKKRRRILFYPLNFYFTYILHEKGHFGQWKRKKYNRSSIFCLILIKALLFVVFFIFSLQSSKCRRKRSKI